MTTRQDFINAIAENPDDLPNRLIYADWLEERGEIDEALRQRDWIPAKQELMSLMELDELPPPQTEYNYYEFIDFLNNASQAGDYVSFGNKETQAEMYNRNPERIWKLWSIITGHRPPMECPRGGCSC